MIECYGYHLKIGFAIYNAAQIDGKIEKWDRLKGNTEFGTRKQGKMINDSMLNVLKIAAKSELNVFHG